MMKTEFQFNGFEPDEALIAEAEGVLDQVLALAPFNAYVASKLEKIGDVYFCEIDVYTKRGSTIASSMQEDPFKALQYVEETILNKLSKTRENKFFTGATAIKLDRRKPASISN